MALVSVAASLAEAGRIDRALRVAQNAYQVAQRIEDAKVRSIVLVGIAGALAEAGQFDRAIEVAEKIDDVLERLKAFATVAAVAREKQKR
jgi:serine protease Do